MRVYVLQHALTEEVAAEIEETKAQAELAKKSQKTAAKKGKSAKAKPQARDLPQTLLVDCFNKQQCVCLQFDRTARVAAGLSSEGRKASE